MCHSAGAASRDCVLMLSDTSSSLFQANLILLVLFLNLLKMPAHLPFRDYCLAPVRCRLVNTEQRNHLRRFRGMSRVSQCCTIRAYIRGSYFCSENSLKLRLVEGGLRLDTVLA